MKLTVERLFSGPPLDGDAPSKPGFSASGKWISYLRAAEESAHSGADTVRSLQLMLCQTPSLNPAPDSSEPSHATNSLTAHIALSAQQLSARALGNEENSAGEVTLSPQEQINRERRRIFAGGIVDYSWHPHRDELLINTGGAWCRYRPQNPQNPERDEVIALPELNGATTPKFSPDGQYIAAVIDADIYCLDLEKHNLSRLTHDGGDTRSNGVAEFIAQEEMHRFDGFWWSPDSQHILFTHVDEAPIPETIRYEISANEVTAVPQRYPFTGGPNASVQLRCWHAGVSTPDGSDEPAISSVLTVATDQYLARAGWSKDSKEIVVQLQSRDQCTLTTALIARPESVRDLPAPANLEGLPQHTQQAAGDQQWGWINLNDDLRALANGSYLLRCERANESALFHLSSDLQEVERISDQGIFVTGLVKVREPGNQLYFHGWEKNPCERHLYQVALDGSNGIRLTHDAGTHQCVVSPHSDDFVWLDLFSNTETATTLKLHTAASAHTIVANDVRTAAHPYAPYLSGHGLSEFFPLTGEDGQQLWCRLLRPADFDQEQRYPVLVHVYGGPGVQRVMNQWHTGWLQYLSRQGYLVFELDNRGSGNRGPAFESPICNRLGQVELADQLRGVAWLKQQSFVDEQRIAIFGHSYGGYMVLNALSHAPGDFCGGISVAPVTQWQQYDTHYTERYLRTPQDNPDGYEASNILPVAQQIEDPLLLIHGMADDNVLFSHTTALTKVLQDANIAFEFMAYPGSRHGLAEASVSRHRYAMMSRFLDKVTATSLTNKSDKQE